MNQLVKCFANECKEVQSCWLLPTVPRSVLRSVGRLNFLDPLTETTEKGERQLLISKKEKRARENNMPSSG